jgi:hypothetical protein
VAEIERISFTHQEVVTALLKSRGIQEGIWSLYVEFGLGATNVASSECCVLPAAVVPVIGIGVRETDTVNNLSVDAAS